MDENYYALALAILKRCTPEQAFIWLDKGLKNKPQPRDKSIDDEVVRLRNIGMTNAQVGECLGLTKFTVSRKYNKAMKAS